MFPSEASFKETIAEFSVTTRKLGVNVVSQPVVVRANSAFTLVTEVLDLSSHIRATKLDWRGHLWTLSAKVCPELGLGGHRVSGTMSVNIILALYFTRKHALHISPVLYNTVEEQ